MKGIIIITYVAKSILGGLRFLAAFVNASHSLHITD